MAAKKKSKPTTLQVFKQKMKLQDLRNKVWEAECALRAMCRDHGTECSKLVLGSTMYEVSVRNEYMRSSCEVTVIGDISELQALIKP
jgi:hypothetical protein